MRSADPSVGHIFLKGKSKIAVTGQGWRPALAPRDTVQWPLGEGRWLFRSLSFLLCEIGVTMSVSQDKVRKSPRIK